MQNSGLIYAVRNKINGKWYVGQTWLALWDRKKSHKSHSLHNYTNSVFHKAIRKYGWDSFVWNVVEEGVIDQERLDVLEIEWIEILDSRTPNGYNIKEGGRGGKHSPESIEKIRQKNKLAVRTEKFKQRVSEVHTGKVNSPETKKKMSESQKKRYEHKPMSVETRKKISEAGKKRKVSSETKKKMSEVHKKRHAENPDLRKQVAKKSSKTQKGKKLTPEHVKALSEAQKKYRAENPMSEETRKKISESMKKRKAEQRLKKSCNQPN